jgi:hypothetical protein
MPVKLSEDLVHDAREEAKAADRSITSQIEHWARLGRQVENLLRHEDVLNLKRADEHIEVPAPTRRAVLTALRRIAAGSARTELSAALMAGRTVYQDAGEGRVERIERDGTRTVGRFVNRRFTPDDSQRALRRR